MYTTWVDNYSHVHPKSVVRCSRLDYIQQLWTVEARCLISLNAGLVDLSTVVEAGVVRPIMPPEMFSYADISGVTDLVKKATSSYNYESSVSVKWNIRSTPPKPDLKKLNAGQIARAMNQSQFMNRFLPVRVHELNIGSNAGLCRYLKMLQHSVLLRSTAVIMFSWWT